MKCLELFKVLAEHLELDDRGIEDNWAEFRTKTGFFSNNALGVSVPIFLQVRGGAHIEQANLCNKLQASCCLFFRALVHVREYGQLMGTLTGRL